ncbi:hypothetical protein NYA22BAC_03470 (plasmid) [Parasphingorhabdus sp. NYA22]
MLVSLASVADNQVDPLAAAMVKENAAGFELMIMSDRIVLVFDKEFTGAKLCVQFLLEFLEVELIDFAV